MSAIKANILRRFDNASIGIRICCIKFVLRVVQVQTPGVIADPRVRIIQKLLVEAAMADFKDRDKSRMRYR